MTAAFSSKMASGKDTASFFTKGSNAQFRYVLSLYPQTLKLKAELKNKKPEELIKLDNWYQNELPKKIKARGKDAHLNHEELVQLMKWKQSRGKAYPQLNYLVKVNTPRAVMAETKKGFKKLPNLEQAITALSNLKGVGTTMASALLAAANPEAAPFMADECLMAIPEIEGIDYTIKEYLNFVNHIQATAERLNKECPNNIEKWNAHQVELALWTHFVASELSPQLLDSIPETNGKAAHQNGECQNDESAENSRGAEETETGDGEDSRAAADEDSRAAADEDSRATPEDQDSAQSDTTHDSERVVAADEDSVDAGATDEDSRAEPPCKKPRAGE